MPASTSHRYDIEAIKRRLPHRYPFLMVDRIEESGPGYAIGIKNVTANEPCFQGHFPQRSIMPGVLIAEALMQTSCFIGGPAGTAGGADVTANAGHDGPEGPEGAGASGARLVCVGMNLKFRSPVVPGDRLRMDVRLVRRLRDMVLLRGTARTDAGVVASGELTLGSVTEERIR